MNKSTVVIVDGHNVLIYAGYAKGTITPEDVCRVFLSKVHNVVDTFLPNNVVVAWDMGKERWRQELLKGTYKGKRAFRDQSLQAKVVRTLTKKAGSLLMTLLPKMGIDQVWAVPRGEADDVIFSLLNDAMWSGRAIIVSSDSDLWQLVTPQYRGSRPKLKVSVLPIKKIKTRQSQLNGLIGGKEVEERTGVWPANYVLYKALVGDPSDNIPGVQGVGAKRAARLVQKYPEPKDLLPALSEAAKEVKVRALAFSEDVISRNLALIKPVSYTHLTLPTN